MSTEDSRHWNCCQWTGCLHMSIGIGIHVQTLLPQASSEVEWSVHSPADRLLSPPARRAGAFPSLASITIVQDPVNLSPLVSSSLATGLVLTLSLHPITNTVPAHHARDSSYDVMAVEGVLHAQHRDHCADNHFTGRHDFPSII